ncbi:MAG: SOS response-associated peptidase [Candidatus Sulfotelmatobacter sp.]
MHWLAILILSSAFHFNDRLVWFGPEGRISRISLSTRRVSPGLVGLGHANSPPIPVIRQNPREPARELSLIRWGLIPSWAKDPSVAARMINARSETAAAKPAFGDALRFRRCLVPADGFYEWARTGKAKQPYCFEVNGGALFAFAGTWGRWKDANGKEVETCSILTTVPNAVTSAVHDRMPVILGPDAYDLWLDPGMRDVGAASGLLRPYDARLMRCYPISSFRSFCGVGTLFQAASHLVGDTLQLLCQSLRDLVKLNKAASLKFNVASVQIVGQSLA